MFTLTSKVYSLGVLCTILTLFTFSISGCTKDPKETGESTPKAASSKESKQKVLKINVDIDTQKRLQSAADQGFKPWKNDAIEVAKECIIGKGIGAPGEARILSKDENVAVVHVNTKKEGNFKVSLKRLVKPGGIWTATEVEKVE